VKVLLNNKVVKSKARRSLDDAGLKTSSSLLFLTHVKILRTGGKETVESFSLVFFHPPIFFSSSLLPLLEHRADFSVS
jgi:hypothetical protein